jgi:Tol biopolymer transport system component
VGRSLTACAALAAITAAAGAAAAASEAPAKPANGSSGNAAISADGRFVAFASEASDLVVGDTNGVFDVFVRDRARGDTERVSVGAAGTQANARTGLTAISADGRFVLMWSEASNLVPGDANEAPDVFVRDRLAGTTERVSVASDGTQANGESEQSAMSADGRFVAFASTASNLADGDSEGTFDVFVRDRSAGRTEHVGAGWMPSISADGRFVAFQTPASLVAPAEIALTDRAGGTTELVSVDAAGRPANGPSSAPTIGGDGRYVAFVSEGSNLVPGDTNGPGRRGADVFVRDRAAGTTARVSVAGDGGQADAESGNPTISSDGGVVAFTSWAADLGAVRGAVFVRDLRAARTEIVSVSTDGRVADGDSYTGSGPVSADGRFVAFFSLATNLVPDTNATYDVFVRDRVAGSTELVSLARSLRLQASPVTLAPARARAGRRLTASVTLDVDGQPVTAALVTCTARIGGMRLTALASSFRASRARCVWAIPRSGRHRMLRGAVSALTNEGRATRTFVSRIR